MSKKKQEPKETTRKEKDENDALANRDVYVFGRLENEVAMPVIRRLLRLAERDAHEPIDLYLNSSGGNGYNADAIIAIMHSITPKVNTICLGHALSGACEILASGTGERSAYEFATLMFHQTIWEAEGDITNLEIQAAQGKKFRDAQIELLHRCTKQDRERIRKDIERDFYLSPEEAVEYGIIDSVIRHKPRKAKPKLTIAQNNGNRRAAPKTSRTTKKAAPRRAAVKTATRATKANTRTRKK